MKTRNLLILAFACGVAILFAGGFKLFQVADDKPTVRSLSIGDTAEVGPMTVRVTGVTTDETATLAHVEIVGVDGDDVGDHWRLIANGTPQPPIALPAGNGPTCADTREATDLACTVAFPPTDGPFVIAYLRGGSGQANWASQE